jgi:hypothetical protein
MSGNINRRNILKTMGTSIAGASLAVHTVGASPRGKRVVTARTGLSDILPRLKGRASHPVLAGQVNPEGWESKVCWTVSQWLCHEAVTRTP